MQSHGVGPQGTLPSSSPPPQPPPCPSSLSPSPVDRRPTLPEQTALRVSQSYVQSQRAVEEVSKSVDSSMAGLIRKVKLSHPPPLPPPPHTVVRESCPSLSYVPSCGPFSQHLGRGAIRTPPSPGSAGAGVGRSPSPVLVSLSTMPRPCPSPSSFPEVAQSSIYPIPLMEVSLLHQGRDRSQSLAPSAASSPAPCHSPNTMGSRNMSSPPVEFSPPISSSTSASLSLTEIRSPAARPPLPPRRSPRVAPLSPSPSIQQPMPETSVESPQILSGEKAFRTPQPPLSSSSPPPPLVLDKVLIKSSLSPAEVTSSQAGSGSSHSPERRRRSLIGPHGILFPDLFTPSCPRAHPVSFLNVFLPNLESEDEELEYIRKREWRILSDEEVEDKLRRPIPTTTIDHLWPVSHVRWSEPSQKKNGEKSLKFTLMGIHCLWNREENNPIVIKKGVLSTMFEGKRESIPFYVLFESFENSSCLDFVKKYFHLIFQESFSWLRVPEVVPHVGLGPLPRTSSGNMFNVLKLATVKLQEAWAHYAISRPKSIDDRKDDLKIVSSGVSICAVFLKGAEMWCLTIGRSRALLFNDTEHTIRYVSPTFNFSNNSMLHSIEKRGGAIKHNPTRLQGVLPVPRIVGAIDVEGLAARPKITRVCLTSFPGESTLLLGSSSIFQTFSSDQLFEIFSDVQTEEEFSQKCQLICTSIIKKKMNEKCACMALKMGEKNNRPLQKR